MIQSTRSTRYVDIVIIEQLQFDAFQIVIYGVNRARGVAAHIERCAKRELFVRIVIAAVPDAESIVSTVQIDRVMQLLIDAQPDVIIITRRHVRIQDRRLTRQ